MSLQRHVDRHAILAMEKQFRLFDIVGERGWSADLEAGTIRFEEITMPVKLIGTESGGAWLWGWANPGGFPPEITVDLRDYGRAHGLELLAEAETPTDDFTAFQVSVLAIGIAGLSATYTGPAEEVNVLFGISDARLDLPPFDVPRLVSVLTQLMQAGLVRDWRGALAAYEEQRGVDLDDVVELELDDLGRVVNLSARAS